MKVLPEKFTLKGFDYHQLNRSAKAAIYEVTSGSTHICYEVIRVTIQPERVITGHITEEGEYYPGTATWGTNGFTCNTRERAEEIFNELNQ